MDGSQQLHNHDECDITDDRVHNKSLSNNCDDDDAANDIDSKSGDDGIYFCDANCTVKDHDGDSCVDDVIHRRLRDDDAAKDFQCYDENNLCDDAFVVEDEINDAFAHSVSLSHILDAEDIYLDDDHLYVDDLTVGNNNGVDFVDIVHPINTQTADVTDVDIKNDVNTDRCVAICPVEKYDSDEPVGSMKITDSCIDVPNQASSPTASKESVVSRNSLINGDDSDWEELPVFDIMSLKPF